MRLSQLKQMPPPLFGGAAGMVDPVSPRRALFNEVLARFEDAPDDLSIMQGTLVSEVVLSQAIAQQQIVWNLRADQQNPTNAIRTTEIRLQQRDAFVCDRFGLFWGVSVGAAALASSVYYQQFPNANTVANNGHTPAGAAAIRAALNGQLSAIVNTVQYLQGLHASAAIYVDTAQASSATTQSAQEGELGFIEMTPAMTVRGTDTSQFTLTIPDSVLFDPGVGNNIVCRLMLRGMLVQGGAAVAV